MTDNSYCMADFREECSLQKILMGIQFIDNADILSLWEGVADIDVETCVYQYRQFDVERKTNA